MNCVLIKLAYIVVPVPFSSFLSGSLRNLLKFVYDLIAEIVKSVVFLIIRITNLRRREGGGRED